MQFSATTNTIFVYFPIIDETNVNVSNSCDVLYGISYDNMNIETLLWVFTSLSPIIVNAKQSILPHAIRELRAPTFIKHINKVTPLKMRSGSHKYAIYENMLLRKAAPMLPPKKHLIIAVLPYENLFDENGRLFLEKSKSKYDSNSKYTPFSKVSDDDLVPVKKIKEKRKKRKKIEQILIDMLHKKDKMYGRNKLKLKSDKLLTDLEKVLPDMKMYKNGQYLIMKLLQTSDPPRLRTGAMPHRYVPAF
ncbi:uncharacterized protein LOC128201596 [Galleria mellonella]|uniref:Uncharacterized protein LOC128201596 n=1 Tax=Galleria mellonella TaxID=7137 RepID=A0ABM3MUG1_GALME|nr:uncharacterized protein LOC128201596 [Galleria mellonella]